MTISSEAAQPTGPDQRELIDALVRASFAVMAVLNRIGAEHDVSLTQLRVLGILRDRRVKMSELADYLGLDKSTISGLVDRAEKRGLLRREPNPVDGRAVDVFLTDEGTELAGRGAAQIARALSPVTGKLTRAEARRLTTLLETILDRDGPSRMVSLPPGRPAGSAPAQFRAMATTARAARPRPARWAGVNRSCRTVRASRTVTPGYSETSTAAMASMAKCVA